MPITATLTLPEVLARRLADAIADDDGICADAVDVNETAPGRGFSAYAFIV